MSELRAKRVKFTALLCEVVEWGNDIEGWEVAFGRDFDEADPNEHLRHMRGSLHYLGLANDLALYINGVYQESTEAYRPLGEYWKSLDPDLCCWGGDFKDADGCHFSITYQGKK